MCNSNMELSCVCSLTVIFCNHNEQPLLISVTNILCLATDAEASVSVNGERLGLKFFAHDSVILALKIEFKFQHVLIHSFTSSYGTYQYQILDIFDSPVAVLMKMWNILLMT